MAHGALEHLTIVYEPLRRVDEADASDIASFLSDWSLRKVVRSAF